MAGKYDWKSVGLCGIPMGFHISIQALCDHQLQNLVHSWRVVIYSMNEEQFNHRIPPLFSFSQHAERWNERKQTEQKIMWSKLQQSRGMFDIVLDCDGRVQSQMCVFVIKQVQVFHLREHTGEWADHPVQSLCCTLLFIMLQNHKHQFLPVPFSHCTLLIL